MKATKNLINALYTLADAIEVGYYNDEYKKVTYDWNTACQCNVGILARELGVNKQDIDKAGIIYWHKAANKYFSPTNINCLFNKQTNENEQRALESIFNLLYEEGIENEEDIAKIEKPWDFNDHIDFPFITFLAKEGNSPKISQESYFRDLAKSLEYELLNSNNNLNYTNTVKVSVKA